MEPKEELVAPHSKELFNRLFDKTMSYEEGFKLLNKLLKERGEYIPPLINIYMGLS